MMFFSDNITNTLGCYADVSGTDLSGAVYANNNSLTRGECSKFCYDQVDAVPFLLSIIDYVSFVHFL